jgi:hypothetical protein
MRGLLSHSLLLTNPANGTQAASDAWCAVIDFQLGFKAQRAAVTTLKLDEKTPLNAQAAPNVAVMAVTVPPGVKRPLGSHGVPPPPAWISTQRPLTVPALAL